jgi:hypothetical protein
MLGLCFFNGLPIKAASLDKAADAGVVVVSSPIPKLRVPARPTLPIPTPDWAFDPEGAMGSAPPVVPAADAEVLEVMAAASGSAE